jgi:hypothetical protein
MATFQVRTNGSAPLDSFLLITLAADSTGSSNPELQKN